MKNKSEVKGSEPGRVPDQDHSAGLITTVQVYGAVHLWWGAVKMMLCGREGGVRYRICQLTCFA